MTRHIAFEGIENFRDFGGYATACGRSVRTGLLYRAAHQAEATDEDLERLHRLGIAVVVDLRRPVERGRQPSRRPAAFAGEVIENDLGVTHDPWVEALKESDLSAAWFRADAIKFYREAPFEARHLDLFARYFRALAQADGGVLVHCAAGKDRTGMLCALTHHLAGVCEDDIFQDYLLTNDEARFARRSPGLAQFIHEISGRAASEDALRVVMGVEPAYLSAAFEVMSERCGSLDGYLEQVLGVDAPARARIHDRLLA